MEGANLRPSATVSGYVGLESLSPAAKERAQSSAFFGSAAIILIPGFRLCTWVCVHGCVHVRVCVCIVCVCMCVCMCVCEFRFSVYYSTYNMTLVRSGAHRAVEGACELAKLARAFKCTLHCIRNEIQTWHFIPNSWYTCTCSSHIIWTYYLYMYIWTFMT